MDGVTESNNSVQDKVNCSNNIDTSNVKDVKIV